MKKIVLRLLYNRYRDFFYAFFEEEMISSIPANISVPAMSFLANGKEKLEVWVLYWIHTIQQRIVIDKEQIQVQQGMILMLKIFLRHVLAQKPARIQTIETETKAERPDFVSEVESVIKGYREARGEE